MHRLFSFLRAVPARQWLRYGVGLLILLTLYCVFLGGLRLNFWIQQELVQRLTTGVQVAGMRLQGEALQCRLLPMRFAADVLRLERQGGAPLMLVAVTGSADLVGFFPPQVRVQADGVLINAINAESADDEEGTVRVEAYAPLHEALLWPLTNKLTVAATCMVKDVSADVLLAFAGAQSSSGLLSQLCRVQGGFLEGMAATQFTLVGKRIPLEQSAGTVMLTLDDARASLALPMLRKTQFEAIQGTLNIAWEGTKLYLKPLQVENEAMLCDLSGEVTLTPEAILNSQLALTAHIKLSPSLLRQELVPPRTLAAFKAKNEVRLRIWNTVQRPSFAIQP